MPFMKPHYYEGIYSVITNKDGESYFVPEEVAYKNASDYCDGEPAFITVQEGVLWHLAAFGYMDQTGWIPAETMEDARAELSAQYDVCAECGADMDERDGILCAECS